MHVVSDGAFGLSKTELLYALRAAAESCSDVIEVRSGPPIEGAAWVQISEAELSINLAKVTGAVLHIEADYNPGELGAGLAIDSLLMAAPAFANVNQFEIASRVITELAPKSTLLRDAGIAMALQGIMVGARRVRESLRIADELDRSKDQAIREASIAFTFPALKLESTWIAAPAMRHGAAVVTRTRPSPRSRRPRDPRLRSEDRGTEHRDGREAVQRVLPR